MTSSSTTASRVAAFFDIDCTLLPAPSLEWRFLAFLLAHDDISASNIARWLARFVRLSIASPLADAYENKLYLRGLPESLVEMWQRSLVCNDETPTDPAVSALPLFAEALARIEWHAARQHAIFLVSGTLAPLARALSLQLSRNVGVAIETYATELESCGGVWTGELTGPHISGKQKALAIAQFASRYGFSLSDSFAYADSITDLLALSSVGHPFAVNPSGRLAHHAKRRHWPIVRWSSTLAERTASLTSLVGIKEAQ